MQRLMCIVGVLTAGVMSGRSAHAQVSTQPAWKCIRGDGTACTSKDLADARYRQVLVMPTGFDAQDSQLFWGDFDKFVATVSNTGDVWSTQYRDRILYVGYFVAGGALGTPEATFGGAVLAHPIRSFALTASNAEVQAKVNSIKATELPELRPMAVQLLFNDASEGISANASPPSFVGASYGIAKLNREDLEAAYITTHELAHAALNFLDEYVEEGLEDTSIRSLDVASPALQLEGAWSGLSTAIGNLLGVYDMNISEILAGNGNHNIATSPTPSTVVSPNGSQTLYPYEGGMLFGRGTFHAAGNNLMAGTNSTSQNGFAYEHSPAQQMLITTAFGEPAYRANDRLRTAGPKNGWPLVFGSATVVMMYDGDKRNAFHPTQHYTVQVGWYARIWTTCWAGFIPYPCYKQEWRVAQTTVKPSPRTVSLSASSLNELASLTQEVLCGVGATQFVQADQRTFNTCDASLANAFVPTFSFETPYQEALVPASQPFTTYYWRFATYNGTTTSGFTGWSTFYRSL